MPPSLPARQILVCISLSLPFLVLSQVRHPPGVNPQQYNQHGQGNQGSRQSHGQGQEHNAQQKFQGQQSYHQGQAENSQNMQGQRPSQTMQGQVPIQNTQGQIPNQNFQGQLPSQNFQGQIPSQNFQGQIPSQNSQGQMPSQNVQGQIPTQNTQGQMSNQPPIQNYEPVPAPSHSNQVLQQQPLTGQHQQTGHGDQNVDKGSVPNVGQDQQYRGSGQPVHSEQQRSQHHDQGHGHGHQNLLHKDIGHEKEHMKEHLDVPMDTSKMSDQELQFHYFKMHDTDGNNKLDGCELVKSLIHWHATDESSHKHGTSDSDGHPPTKPPKIFEDNELSGMIDPILVSDDRNKDGFIDYYEFVAAQNAQVKASS